MPTFDFNAGEKIACLDAAGNVRGRRCAFADVDDAASRDSLPFAGQGGAVAATRGGGGFFRAWFDALVAQSLDEAQWALWSPVVEAAAELDGPPPPFNETAWSEKVPALSSLHAFGKDQDPLDDLLRRSCGWPRDGWTLGELPAVWNYRSSQGVFNVVPEADVAWGPALVVHDHGLARRRGGAVDLNLTLADAEGTCGHRL